MKNFYNYLKEKYQCWLPITQRTGNIYDSATNTIHTTNDEWDEYIKAHPKASTLRHSPFPFPDLYRVLFDGAAATGVHQWGPSSSMPRPGAVSAPLELPEIKRIYDNDTDDGDANPSSHTSKSCASNTRQEERPKKKNKTSTSHSELEEKMLKTMDLIIQTNKGPSVGEYIDRLDGLGWGANCSLYVAASGSFVTVQVIEKYGCDYLRNH